jgi:hypothetical protein
MHPAAHFLTRISPNQARRAVEQLLTERMTGKPVPGANPALEDLRSLPADATRLSSLIEAMFPDSKRSSPTPWHLRSGFTDLLDPAIRVVSREFPAPEHRTFTRMLEARNYLPNQFIVGIDGMIVEKIGSEGGEFHNIREVDLDIETGTTQLDRWGAILSLTVESIENDDSGLFARSTEGLVAACYRREATGVYSVLESSPTLADGAPWWNSSNEVSASAIDADAIAQALEVLANQKFSDGEYLDAAPVVLVLPASAKIAAGSVLEDMKSLKIIKTGRVSKAYLFADPTRAPAIGLAGFGDMIPTIDTNPRPSRQYGLQLRAEHQFSVLPLSRKGVVRISVA